MIQKIAILIVAGGNSSRLGSAKQLLPFQGKTLLRRIVDEACLDPAHSVYVVLGAEHERMQEELLGTKATAVLNKHWMEGMSSSISVGIHAILKAQPELSHCIIAVCDQPFVEASLFQALKKEAEKSGRGIITTGFAETWGTPCLFSKAYFPELLALEGPKGARPVVLMHLEDMHITPFPAAAIDVDSMTDYYNLPHRMVSVDEAHAILKFFIPKYRKHSFVPLMEALGSTLASDVFAKYAIPGFAQSSMDGYAIRYEDRTLPLTLKDKIPAGSRVQKTLKQGEAMRIFTGSPLPEGADTVVMQEKIKLDADGYIYIQDEELQQGDNVRKKGSEVAENALAIASGTPLTAAALGYLAGLGCAEVCIYGAPHISIILTGDELIPVGQPPTFGEVYESNSYQLRAALLQLGIPAGNIEVLQVKDSLHEVQACITLALEKSNIILMVGGVSVGEYDYVVEAAKACGVEQRFHGIRQKPGKPLFFGSRGEQLLFGLPGNPASALSCFYLHVATVLEELMHKKAQIQKISAPITGDYNKKVGLTHFLKGNYNGSTVTALHAQESYRLQSFAQANCLIVLDENTAGCIAGELVDIHLLHN